MSETKKRNVHLPDFKAKTLFDGQRGLQPWAAHSAPDRLYSEIGRLKMALNGLKKSPRSACHHAPKLVRQGRHGCCDVAMRTGRRHVRPCLCAAKAQRQGSQFTRNFEPRPIPAMGEQPITKLIVCWVRQRTYSLG